MKEKSNKVEELKTNVTNMLIENINECLASDWKKSWINVGKPSYDPVSDHYYQGFNMFSLSLLTAFNGYSCAEYATFNQWKEIGFVPNKGSKGLSALQPLMRKGTDKESGDDITFVGGFRAYSVFNADQVVDIDNGDPYKPENLDVQLNENDRIKKAEKFFNNCNVKMVENGDVACYIPSKDKIMMPTLEQFDDGKSYYATLFHELTHASGHKDRLNRDLNNGFNAKGYAYEELIAEIGSAFIMSHLGLDHKPRKDHSEYLKGWLKGLENDINFIFKASAQSGKALDYYNKMQ